MSWVAVAIGGAAVVGGVSSYASSKQAAKGNRPWSGQRGYLEDSFSQSHAALGDALNQGTYDGDRVAGLHQYQTGAAGFLGDYGYQQGMPAAKALGQSGMGFLGYGSQFADNASNIYNQYSNGDATGSIINAAGQYANNPYVDGMVDAANRDIGRSLNEQQLPNLARGAAASGNTNSTRAGVESAILQRGAADRMADNSMKIRGQFFGQGLEMGQKQYNQNLQNMLQANNPLLQAFQQGGNTIIQGQQVSGNTWDQMSAAGGLMQGHQQAKLDALRQRHYEDQNNALDLIGKHKSIVDGNYGMAGHSNPWASAATGAMGGALSAYGTYQKLGDTSTQPVVQQNYSNQPSYQNSQGQATYGNYDLGGSNTKFGGS